MLELLHQAEIYSRHDARFELQQLVRIAGELTARHRSILSGKRAVPQLLVRGSRSDRAIEIAGSCLIGVSMGIVAGKKQTKVRAFLKDRDSGTLIAVERTFADPDSRNLPTRCSYAAFYFAAWCPRTSCLSPVNAPLRAFSFCYGLAAGCR